MARGRAWTPDEDALSAKAAALNRRNGRSDPDREYGQRRERTRRLHKGAERIGRTPAAVHKRAQRIAERSHTTWDG